MRKAAFTLIELLIVIAIIGILTSIATASYLKAQSRSRDSARKSSVNAISTAVEAFYSAKAAFPGDPYILGNQREPIDPPVYNKCEQFSFIDEGTLTPGKAPVSVFIPGQDCSTGTSKSSETLTRFKYDPNDYLPIGTWIAGLGTYLNPFPREPHFTNILGTSETGGSAYHNPYDVLASTRQPSECVPVSSSVCGVERQKIDLSRTLYYRNLNTGYLVYARLESDRDSDFNAQFTVSKTVSGVPVICLQSGVPGLVNVPDQLSCVPTVGAAPNNPTNPITLYLIRK